MAWFLNKILVPMTLPLIFLLLAKLVDLPQPSASRVKLIRAVQGGQLGWVAMGLAASCSYELLDYLIGRKNGAPVWAGLVFALSGIILAVSGFLLMMGTHYPVDDSKLKPITPGAWIRHYRLFVGTLLTTLIAAALLSLVHYILPTA